MSPALFKAPDLTLEAAAQEDRHVLMRGTYKGIPVKKAAILEDGAKCLVLLDPFSCLDQGAFKNLFCVDREGHTVWIAPLPETHDRFGDFHFRGEKIVAYSVSGYLVTLEWDTGRVVDQVFVK
jgi:hypothetical protein